MAVSTVPIRLSVLLCPDLTASSKLVWLGLRLDGDLKQKVLRSPTRIQRRIGVSRPTIRRALGRLKEPLRPQVAKHLSSLCHMQVRVNPELITDSAVPAMARVVYCVLLGLKRLKRFKILASYGAIAKVLHVQARTVRLAVRALVAAGWLAISQKTQRSPLRFSFPNPKVARQSAEIRRAEQRLEKSKYHGEALALLWCDALVDSTNHQDDSFPKAFTNPLTNKLLQADRFYVDYDVAVEFNGPQHDGPTLQFSAAEAEAQMARDRIKEGICRHQKMSLLTLRPEDLTYQRLREILGSVLPLRDVTADEPIIAHLEKKSRRYRESIERIRRQSQSPRSGTGSDAHERPAPQKR